MKINFVKSNEKRRILTELNEKFGIDEIKGVLVETGKGKIREFTGSMSREEMQEFAEIARVEIVGLYVIRREKDGLRLSLDGTLHFKPKNNIFVLSDGDAELWMKGQDLFLEEGYGFKIIKNKDDLLGCGKSTSEKIVNFIPKERRIRKS